MQLSDIVGDPAPLLSSWPTEPLQWQHRADRFAGLLTMEEVNEWVDAGCVAIRNVELIEEGRVLERHRYQGPNEMPAPGRVRAHLAAGGTVSLRHLETVKPSVSRLRSAVQEATGCAVHVNAYITPGGCQGFRYHYDPYVTLILQVHGRKTWLVHPPVMVNPVTEYGNFLERGFTDEEREYLAVTPPPLSFTLEPGTAFWLPRGFIHAPYTDGEETSVHLTVAVRERTPHWVAERLVTEILAGAWADPALRAVVPPADLTAGPVDAVARMRDYLIGSLLQLTPAETAAMADLVGRAARRIV
ncbi:JmjC domain-containing protein [Kitasatospora cinereorecta]